MDLLADSHNISNRWKNYFSQLLNVHMVSDLFFPPMALQPFLGPWPHILVSKSILHRR
jgi:hypothetical protein